MKDKLHGFFLQRLAGLDFPEHPCEREEGGDEEGEVARSSGFGEP